MAGREPRLLALGGVLLVIAVGFASPVLRKSGYNWLAVPTDAFLPWLMWMFFLQFPAAQGRQRLQEIWLTALLLLSLLLFCANLFLMNGLWSADLSRFAHATSDVDESSLFDGLIYGLTFLSLPVFIYRTFRASSEERSRAMFFLLILCASVTLPTLFILWVSFDDALGLPKIPEVYFGNIRDSLNILLLLNPVAVAYAVVVDEIIPTRHILRRSIRFLIGQYVLGALCLVPILILLVNVYLERHNTIAELTADPIIFSLLLLAIVGVAMFRARDRISAVLLSRFFMDSYNLEHALTEAVTLGEQATDQSDLLSRGVVLLESWLTPEHINLFRKQDMQEEIGDTITSEIAQFGQLIFRPNANVVIDQWMRKQDFTLVLPLYGVKGNLDSIIGLGAKKSGDSYENRDRRLLVGFSRAIELALEALQRYEIDESPTSAAPLQVCEQCHVCYPEEVIECHGATRQGSLPIVFSDRFRIDQLIGSGNSGDVYSAYDQSLHRHVAIKTLIRTTKEEARMIRRESIVAAGFSNENLAAIHDVREWKERPILIFEKMEKGSLSDRIAKAPLELSQVTRLAHAMAAGLTYLHNRGVLHRDIKPGNIGYTEDDQPKLLDFGLTKLAHPAAMPPIDLAQTETMHTTLSKSGCVGTPLYWSPEVLSGNEAGPRDDVWALCVVLFEALTGAHPFERASWMESATAILQSDVRIPSMVDGASMELVDLLADSLSSRADSRLDSAESLARLLG